MIHRHFVLDHLSDLSTYESIATVIITILNYQEIMILRSLRLNHYINYVRWRNPNAGLALSVVNFEKLFDGARKSSKREPIRSSSQLTAVGLVRIPFDCQSTGMHAIVVQ